MPHPSIHQRSGGRAGRGGGGGGGLEEARGGREGQGKEEREQTHKSPESVATGLVFREELDPNPATLFRGQLLESSQVLPLLGV